MPVTQEQLQGFDRDGVLIVPDFCTGEALGEIRQRCDEVIRQHAAPAAGLRNLLGADPIVTRFCCSDPMIALARSVLGPAAQPVRTILFDKTPAANWGVPWHQDLNIAVSGTECPPGYGPRSVKEGVPHIVPPGEVLAAMVTLRLHLGPCGVESGPLVVAAGTHRVGKRSGGAPDTAELKTRAVTCCASAGDLVVMRPLAFHRSSKATSPIARRVLHVEYAAAQLDGDLDWYFRAGACGQP
jgi:ectoine hydroxylase-related dioxygenase (phytanoyl-CoA dioxygenase family)